MPVYFQEWIKKSRRSIYIPKRFRHQYGLEILIRWRDMCNIAGIMTCHLLEQAQDAKSTRLRSLVPSQSSRRACRPRKERNHSATFEQPTHWLNFSSIKGKICLADICFPPKINLCWLGGIPSFSSILSFTLDICWNDSVNTNTVKDAICSRDTLGCDVWLCYC